MTATGWMRLLVVAAAVLAVPVDAQTKPAGAEAGPSAVSGRNSPVNTCDHDPLGIPIGWLVLAGVVMTGLSTTVAGLAAMRASGAEEAVWRLKKTKEASDDALRRILGSLPSNSKSACEAASAQGDVANWKWVLERLDQLAQKLGTLDEGVSRLQDLVDKRDPRPARFESRVNPSYLSEAIPVIGSAPVWPEARYSPPPRADFAGEAVPVAWRAFFAAEGGRFKGDLERLRSDLQKALGRALLDVRRHPRCENLAVVLLQHTDGSQEALGVPLHHGYANVEDFFTVEGGKFAQKLNNILAAAVLDPQNFSLVTKGRVTT